MNDRKKRLSEALRANLKKRNEKKREEESKKKKDEDSVSR